jgi:hypothetical protein
MSSYMALHVAGTKTNTHVCYRKMERRFNSPIYPPLTDQKHFAVESSCVCYYKLAGIKLHNRNSFTGGHEHNFTAKHSTNTLFALDGEGSDTKTHTYETQIGEFIHTNTRILKPKCCRTRSRKSTSIKTTFKLRLFPDVM